MQSDTQSSESKEEIKAPEPVHMPPPNPVLSATFKLPLENTEKMHRGLILGIIVGVGVLVLLAFAVWGIAMALSPRHESAPPVVEQKASAIPAGWKKYASKKFGVSFIAPEKWTVKEDDRRAFVNTTDGIDLGYWVTVRNPDESDNPYQLGFMKAKLDKTLDAAEKYEESQGTTVTREAQKWQEYEAAKVRYERKHSVFTRMYVQVGEYTMILPLDNTMSTDLSSTLPAKTNQNFEKYIGSIHVDKKAVEAQAKEKIELPTGKDIVLGSVTVPSGWKKGTTTKYGISYAAPSAWVAEEEHEGLSNGLSLRLTMSDAELPDSPRVTIGVAKAGLQDTVANMLLLYDFYRADSVKVEKMKWLGYDARRMIVDLNGSIDTTIYVQVGAYVYIFPDSEAGQSSTNKFEPTVYKQFIETIRIKPTP